MVLAVNLSGYQNESTSTSLSYTLQIADIVDDVFLSDTMVDIVEKNTGKEFTSLLNAYQIKETNLIEVSVTNENPEEAHESMLAVQNAYQTIIDSVFNDVIVTQIRNPVISVSNYNSNGSLLLQGECGIACGLLVMALIILISYMRNTVKNESDFDSLLNIKHFGTVYKEKIKKDKSNNTIMITDRDTSYAFKYSIKKMAVKLESLQRTRNVKTVLFTSVFENEGKTTVSTNIAAALSYEGKKVVILDFDLKNPSIRKMFDGISYDSSHDMVNYLRGTATLDDIIQVDEKTGLNIISNFRVHRNSAELLRTDAVKNLIKKLETLYDFVIIDSPPCTLVADAEILVEYASATVFVIAQDYTEIPAINDCLENFEDHYVIGGVFNNVSDFKHRIDRNL